MNAALSVLTRRAIRLDEIRMEYADRTRRRHHVIFDREREHFRVCTGICAPARRRILIQACGKNILATEAGTKFRRDASGTWWRAASDSMINGGGNDKLCAGP